MPASHIVLLQRGAPVFEDIGGVDAYCDFYFDPKSMKANRFLACEMGRTGRMGNPECMLKNGNHVSIIYRKTMVI